MSRALKRLETPIGPMQAEVEGGALRRLLFCDTAADAINNARDAALLQALENQLAAYFSGARLHFELALAPQGSAFEQQVWCALGSIPPGETRSYGELARALGQPGAARAVGLANARNPIAILIPCHRVIGSDGRLTGYAGGLSRKEALLRLEGALLAQLF